MKSFKIISSISFFITCILVLSFHTFINQPRICEENCNFTISKGENLKTISIRLENENFISSSLFFQIYSKIKGGERNIRAGDYQFDSSMTIKNIYQTITNKDSVINNHFIILEGETLAEIEENLKEKGLIEKTASLKQWQLKDFFDLFNLNKLQILNFGIFSNLSPEANLEGFLYPDSYHLPQGLTEKEILSIFINNFVSKIDNNLHYTDLLPIVNEQKRSFYDILIMASLLEKEVINEEDKKIVADIIWRRLDNDFLLQIDAAICYAQCESFKKCSLSRDLFKLDSPYNTYLYKGLPPTPINNPSIESMKAALEPKPNKYWYYLTDRQTGNTIFSETYDKHLDARAKYF